MAGLVQANEDGTDIWSYFFNISIDDYLNNTLSKHLLHNTVGDNTSTFNFQDESFKLLLEDLISDLTNVSNITNNEYQLIPKNNVLHDIPIFKEVPTSFAPWAFIQGLVLGQLSIVLLLLFFLKYFIFADGPKCDQNPPVSKKILPHRSKNSDKEKTDNLTTTLTSSLTSFSTILKRGGEEVKTISNETDSDETYENSERSVQIKNILEKTSYDVNLHDSESLDWFNVLIAQIIEQFREEAVNKNNILGSLNNFITNNFSSFPAYLDTIKVTELDIGNNFPLFSNCRIENEKQQLEAKIDIDLQDRLALGVETRILINYPKASFAALPVSLTVAVVKFHGSLTVSLTRADEFVHPQESSDTNKFRKEIKGKDGNGYFLIFSFSPEYILEFDTSSLIGARSKLENIPKVASLIEYQIKKWFVERCVEPRFQFVKLPSIWPRSKNVREEKNDKADKNDKTDNTQ